MTEIKALEWYASSMTNDIGDKTTRYGASPMTNVFYWIFEGSNGFILQGRGTFPTVEAAQEAAHDEWSRRVRSCLVDISTPPARDAKIEALEKENATLKAGIKRLSDEEELINETGRDGMLSAVHIGARLAEAEELARAMEAEANQMREVSISHRNRAEALEESLKTVLASLVATTSLIIRAEDLKVKPSKAVASDKMFTQMLKDYDKATIAGRAALSTPPAAAVTFDPDEWRDEMSAISSYLGAGMGDDQSTAAYLAKRIRWGIDEHVNGTIRMCAAVVERLSQKPYTTWGDIKSAILELAQSDAVHCAQRLEFLSASPSPAGDRDALIERLVKALEPFATVEPMHVFSAEDDDDNGDYVLTENQFRFARAALAAAKEQQP